MDAMMKQMEDQMKNLESKALALTPDAPEQKGKGKGKGKSDDQDSGKGNSKGEAKGQGKDKAEAAEKPARGPNRWSKNKAKPLVIEPSQFPAGTAFTTATSFKTCDFTKPTVVSCETAQQLDDAKAWVAARGNPKNVTLVDFSSEGNTAILVQGSVGPRPKGATLHASGSGAAAVLGLPDGIKDDAPRVPAPKGAQGDFTLLRITLIKSFADQGLFTRASKYYGSLPSLILPPNLQGLLIGSKAAMPYKEEVTCLISVRTSEKQIFLDAARLPGVVVICHREELIPAYIPWSLTEPSGTYWARVAEIAKACGGRVAFRPRNRNCLGVTGGNDHADFIAPQWYLSQAPGLWNEATLSSWASARGFINPHEIQRRGTSAWLFRAKVPNKNGSALSFSFQSGITVANVKRRKHGAEKSGKEARSSWGCAKAPEDKQGKITAAVPGSRDVEAAELIGLKTGTGTDADADISMVTAGGAEKEADPKRDDADGKSETKQDSAQPKQRRKVEVPQPILPFAADFVLQDCGGAGDCAPCAIGTALNEANKGGKSADALKPAGPVQADLRLCAASEIKKNWQTYLYESKEAALADAAKVQASGTPLGSQALYALAQACQLDLRIWAWSHGYQRWHLHRLQPHKKKDKKAPQIVHLALSHFHYQWLKPKSSEPSAVMKDALKSAYYKLDHFLSVDEPPPGTPDVYDPLVGAGRSDSSAKERLRALGIGASSSSGDSAPPSSAAGGSKTSRAAKTRLRALGIGGHSSAAGSSGQGLEALGISAAAFDPEDASDQHLARPLARYDCPCGAWPTTPLSVLNAQTKARTHWLKCQGKLPPKQTSQDKAHFLLQNRGKIAEIKKANAIKSYHDKRKAFSSTSPQIVGQMCKLNFNDPSWYAPPGGGQGYVRYACSRCKVAKETTKTFVEQCSARLDRSISLFDFRCVTRGKSRAEAAKLSRKLGAKRHQPFKSEETKAKHRARSKARYHANKDKFKAYAWARYILRDTEEKEKFLAHRKHLTLVRKLKGTVKQKQAPSRTQLDARKSKYKAKAADASWRAIVNKKAALNRVLRIGFTAGVAYKPKLPRKKTA